VSSASATSSSCTSKSLSDWWRLSATLGLNLYVESFAARVSRTAWWRRRVDCVRCGSNEIGFETAQKLCGIDHQPRWGVQRINGQSVDHDIIPEGFYVDYVIEEVSHIVLVVKVNKNEDPTLTTYDVLEHKWFVQVKLP
jgi:hypothetical protein